MEDERMEQNRQPEKTDVVFFSPEMLRLADPHPREQQERLEISPGVTETVRRSSCERYDAVAERFMPEALKRVAGLSGGIFSEFHDVFPV